MFIQPWLDVHRLRSRLFRRRISADENLNQEYPVFCSVLAERNLGAAAPSLETVKHYAAKLLNVAEVYRRVLEQVRPKAVFVVSYYSLEGMAINLACREMGIPSVDLQHGIQGDLHAAYARWQKIPDDGFELLPEIFWVWDESDAATIRMWSGSANCRHRPVVGGNLWMNEWRYGEGDIVAGYDRIMQDAIAATPGKHHALVTLQTGLANEVSLGELLSAVRGCQQNWRWWVRLHPCMLDEREAVRAMLQKHGIQDAEIDLATDLPLYALLRFMDIHVTHSSSTVIEAELFGIPSIVTSSFGAEFFPGQLASGWAIAAFTAGDILAAIDRQWQAKSQFPTPRAPLPAEYPGIDEIMALLAAPKFADIDAVCAVEKARQS